MQAVNCSGSPLLPGRDGGGEVDAVLDEGEGRGSRHVLPLGSRGAACNETRDGKGRLSARAGRTDHRNRGGKQQSA